MGKTILVSSHILSELADFCTSIGDHRAGQAARRPAASRRFSARSGCAPTGSCKVRVLDESTEPRGKPILRDDRSGQIAVESFDHTDRPPKSRGRTTTWPGSWAQADPGAGVSVQSFAEEPLSLEDVFMMITKGIVN